MCTISKSYTSQMLPRASGIILFSRGGTNVSEEWWCKTAEDFLSFESLFVITPASIITYPSQKGQYRWRKHFSMHSPRAGRQVGTLQIMSLHCSQESRGHPCRLDPQGLLLRDPPWETRALDGWVELFFRNSAPSTCHYLRLHISKCKQDLFLAKIWKSALFKSVNSRCCYY